MQGAAQARDPGFQVAPMLAEHLADGRGVVGLPRGDGGANLNQRQVKGAQQVYQLGLRHLVTAVEPVAGRAVDRGWPQKANAVVVPQCLAGQPAAAGHLPDRQQPFRRFLPHANHGKTLPRGKRKRPGTRPPLTPNQE